MSAKLLRGHRIEFHYYPGYEGIVTVDIDEQPLKDEGGEIREFRDSTSALTAAKEQLGIYEDEVPS